VFLLSIQAFAAGNSIIQSNNQQAHSAIYQSSSNTAMVIGDNNHIIQNNELDSNGAQYSEHVSQNAVNSIIAEGDSNNATQSNTAFTYMLTNVFGEFTDITQIQSNLGTITGIGNSLNQNNYAITHNYGFDNVVHQTESNLATISGDGDMSYQYNYQYAYPDEASPMLLGDEFFEENTDIIEQVATNDVVMTGGYDQSSQDNYQYAYQEMDTDTYLNQTTANYNVVTSSVDWLPCV